VVELRSFALASEQDLSLVHAAAYAQKLREQAAKEAPCVVADFEEPPDNVTYISPTSYDDAVKVTFLGTLQCAYPY
jgi:hypothetical protein